MTDPLERFVTAQDSAYPRALAELNAGAKRSHWMWYIFPQLAGLGQSPTARHYAIRDMDEARRYLAHPVLGARYLEATRAMLGLRGGDPVEILGAIDALKLRSSLTLFARAGADAVVATTLAAFFAGEDAATVRLLTAARGN